ncbi:hypothetical protein ACFW81_24200 [Streptomyces angustmyceticus]|uniref:hypothetical protein n=1 Tax=Streptomyces angustmyceticus TaxID=285578 RepID=UPI0036A99C6A
MEPVTWTAVIVAVLAMLGTAYQARQSRLGAGETAKRDNFQLLYERQDKEMTELRERQNRMDRSMRILLSHVRDLREFIRRAGAEPPPPPDGLDLSPWDEIT